jgi:UDP-2,3-diacylglucosamine pyrophosphatase LpxH
MFNEYINELPSHKRLIVIGDIHGDIRRFKNILVNAKVINNNLEWIAEPPETIIIQLGDQIDSLNRTSTEEWEVLKDYEMIYFTDYLNLIARAKGGYCISLIGNHELMNVIGDFSYVSDNSNSEIRKQLFKPKGTLALILAKRPLIVKIKDLIFCHAKLGLEHLELLKKRNKDIFYLNYLWKNYMENGKIALEDKQIFDEIIIGHNGILWNRNDNNKNQTEELFKQIGVKYMFLGHTALEKITIIDNQIFYCDTGLSRAFGTNKYQYIDINNRNINIKTIE